MYSFKTWDGSTSCHKILHDKVLLFEGLTGWDHHISFLSSAMYCSFINSWIWGNSLSSEESESDISIEQSILISP